MDDHRVDRGSERLGAIENTRIGRVVFSQRSRNLRGGPDDRGVVRVAPSTRPRWCLCPSMQIPHFHDTPVCGKPGHDLLEHQRAGDNLSICVTAHDVAVAPPATQVP